MDYFDYKDDALVCESVSLEAIAESVGTPVYVYSQATLQRHVRVLDAAFDKTPHRLCYAVKANSNLTLLKRFVEWGTGFEVVSGGELFRVLEAGASPESVILSGVGKTRDEIRQALDAGVLFLSVESQAELELISEVAVQTGNSARVVFRINPDVDPRTHPYISTGLERNKFGISLSDAASVIPGWILVAGRRRRRHRVSFGLSDYGTGTLRRSDCRHRRPGPRSSAPGNRSRVSGCGWRSRDLLRR